jgi:hypothetical protein
VLLHRLRLLRRRLELLLLLVLVELLVLAVLIFPPGALPGLLAQPGELVSCDRLVGAGVPRI